MRGSGAAMLALVVLAGCKPAAPEAPVAPRVDQPRVAPVATAAPFVNTEYGVSAVFPAGARVCEALSGEHPHGFYTRLGDDRTACVPSSDPPKVSSLVIWADYNAAEQSIEALTETVCPDGASAAADGGPLAFPGRRSVACESRRGDDIRISVVTFVGTERVRVGGPNWDGVRPVPELVYTAYLNTTVDRVETDRATLRRFLDGVVLRGPDASGPLCVWTRGVVFVANGTPSVRMKVPGRVLGVTSWMGDESPDVLPAEAWTALKSRDDLFGTDVTGDWRICPKETRPGAMRLVQVVGARDLSVSIR